MGYRPISGAVPQYAQNAAGNGADGHYLKFYGAGGTTPLSMATDDTGGTTLAKCALNSRGEPISNENDDTSVFIPHLNADYKIVLYANATDADNNTTANALFVVDNLSLDFLDSLSVDDYAALRALDTSVLSDGQVITVTDSGIFGDFVMRNVAGHGLSDNAATLIVLDVNWYAERIWFGKINVEWFGAKRDGVTDDQAAIAAAIAYAGTLQASQVVADNNLTIFSIPTVFFPSGIYYAGSSLTSDASPSVSYINLEGDNAIIEAASGITVFGGVSGNTTIKGFKIVSGQNQLSIKTGNLDASIIRVIDCEFQAPQDRAVQIDATSNSTFLRFEGCKFTAEYNLNGSTDIIYAESGDFVSFEDCWFSWNTALDAAMYLESSGNYFNNCVFIPTGGDIYSWINWQTGTLTIKQCTFGSEANVTNCFMEVNTAPSTGSPTNASRLSIEECTINIASNPPLMRFYRIPNMVNIEKCGGASLSATPLYFDSTIPAGDLNVIGNKNFMLWTIDGNIIDLNGYVDYDQADIKAFVGLPLQRKTMRKLNSGVVDRADVLAHVPYTNNYGLFNSGTTTVTTPTGDRGEQIFRFTSTADDQTVSSGYNTLLSGIPALVLTAVIHVRVTTAASINLEVTAGRSTESFVVTTGDALLHLPFYHDGGTVDVVSLTASMANTDVLEWHRTTIFEGSKEMNTPNLVMYGGSTPPTLTTGFYIPGDIMYYYQPTAGGFTGEINTAVSAAGTWKTFGAVSV